MAERQPGGEQVHAERAHEEQVPDARESMRAAGGPNTDQGDGIAGQGGNPGSGTRAQPMGNENPGSGDALRASTDDGREGESLRQGGGGYGNDTGFTGGTVGSRDAQ